MWQTKAKLVALSLLLVGVKASHDPIPALSQGYALSTLNTQPLSYFQAPTIAALALPSVAHESRLVLAELQVQPAQFQILATELVRQPLQFVASAWHRYLDTWSGAQIQQLATELVTQQAWSALNWLNSHYQLADEQRTLLALHVGLSVAALPLNYATRLQLQPHSIAAQACASRVLVVVENLAALATAERLIKAYQQSPEPAPHSFCFSVPLYANGALSCQQNDEGAFAQCLWRPFLRQFQTVVTDFDFAVVITQVGKANVQHGVMTVSQTVEHATFIHELMHFHGFEDEYPFSAAKASWRCNKSGLIAPNLFVGRREDAPANWQPSPSCEKGLLPAFRPSQSWSKMQYQTVALDAQYRQLWRQEIAEDKFADIKLAHTLWQPM
ncbi:hypothetical protein ACFOEE_14640 [Pseudoalteromonas fenneropenaei]|uniref:Uncharacterized protein n=1 Tax=Pseudoalteromonas fenneropenaei TaxID=1737459 RepID=A0ABV7CMK6_9GAMM